MKRTACLIAAALSLGDVAQGFNVNPSASLRSHTGFTHPLELSTANPRRRHHMTRSLKAVMSEARTPILVTGNNVDMTEPLKDYINKKVGSKLDKVGGDVSKVDVHISVNKNPRISTGHVAEVTVFVKGNVIRASEATENMYASIDLVSDRIMRKLRQFKERKLSAKRQRQSVSDVASQMEKSLDGNAEEEDEEELGQYEDPLPTPDMSVVKEKSFPMPAITVEEAVLCLGYIDHDFYVFRNTESNEINVVYKRNHGGVGLIQPEAEK